MKNLNKSNAVRIVAFLVTVLMLGGAGVSVIWFLGRSDAGLGFSVGMCQESSVDDLIISQYLESKAYELEQPAGTDDTPVIFVIEPGETAVEIATRLEEAGLISDGELFRRYVQYHELDAGIEAGEFTLRQTMTIPEIAAALQSGLKPEQAVTIQEGLRLEQVAATVADQTGISQAEFMSLVTTGWRSAGLSYDFLIGLPANATLEGYLFPETYRLPEDATALDLLTRMLDTFDARVTSEMQAAAANRGLTGYELIVLASIVEREAVLDDERALIAGVYQNRVDSGWFLNADPTVQYAIGMRPGTNDWWPVLTLADLEVSSLYNTYRNLGLPPGPICSPGIASIEATAYSIDTEFFYFMADCIQNDGSHLFAVTEDEHLANYALCGGTVP